MNKNIAIGYFLSFINELYLPIAVWLLFFLKYLDFTEVAFLGALSTVSGNIFEIPTGAISDLIGRKWTLFLSFVVSVIGLLTIAYGNIFLVFAIGRIINGLGTALYSGTHESFMYDTLKSAGKEHTYDHVVARSETYAWVGLFFASIIGGVIYDVWNEGPFVVTAIIYTIAAVVCMFLDEPNIDTEHFTLKNYVKQNVQGFRELFQSKKIGLLTFLFITVSSCYFIAAKILGISQAEQYGLDGKGIGLLFGSGYIIAAIISYYYPVLRKKFGNARLLIIASCTLLASFIFAKYVGVIMGSMLITARISSSTTFNNAKSVIMNRFIESKNRATALSTLALLSQIPFTLSFYFIGKYIDTYSPNSFAFVLGISMILFIIPQLLMVKKFFFQNKDS